MAERSNFAVVRDRNIAKANDLMKRLTAFAEAEPPLLLTPVEQDDPVLAVRYNRAMSEYVQKQMTPAQVTAAQAVLKKLLPDLSAVEQTNVDDRDMMSEAQILEQMEQLIAASPDIASKLRSLLTPTAVPDTDDKNRKNCG
jgi:hypothetical protein